MKENEKIREITTVYAPVTEKYIPYYFEPAPAVKFWNSVQCTVDSCWSAHQLTIVRLVLGTGWPIWTQGYKNDSG